MLYLVGGCVAICPEGILRDRRNAEQQRLTCKSQTPLSSLQAVMRGQWSKGFGGRKGSKSRKCVGTGWTMVRASGCGRSV